MSDPEIAAILRDYCSRRLSGFELALVSGIAEGIHVDATGAWLSVEDRRAFEGLKTQFAPELSNP